MLYPYELYLSLLVIKGFDNTTVTSRLKSFGLVQPDASEIDEKRTEIFSMLPDEMVAALAKPNKFSFAAIIDKFSDSLKVFEIEEIIPVLASKPNFAWDNVIYVMSDPHARVAMQCLVLFGSENEEIAKVMKDRYSVDLGLEGVRLFKKYFWNIERMSKLELYNYISAVANGKVRGQYLEAFHRKKETTAWRFAGENMLTLESILKEIMNEAFFRFRSSVNDGDPEAIHRIAKWAELTIKAAEKFDRVHKKDAMSLVDSLKFKLQKMSQSDIMKKEDIDGEVV